MLVLAVWAAPLLAVPLLLLWPWDRQHSCAAFLTSHSLMVGVVLTSTLAKVTHRAVGIYRSGSGLPAGTPGSWRSQLGAVQLQLAELFGWEGYRAVGAASRQQRPGRPSRRRRLWGVWVDRVGQRVAALLITWVISLLLSSPVSKQMQEQASAST